MKKLLLFGAFIILFASIPTSHSNACRRVVYKGPNSTIMTGRTMDFSMEIPANHWIFPRGMKRNGDVMMLDLSENRTYSGETSAEFVKSESFK